MCLDKKYHKTKKAKFQTFIYWEIKLFFSSKFQKKVIKKKMVKRDYSSNLNLFTTKSLSNDNTNEAALGPCFLPIMVLYIAWNAF